MAKWHGWVEGGGVHVRITQGAIAALADITCTSVEGGGG